MSEQDEKIPGAGVSAALSTEELESLERMPRGIADVDRSFVVTAVLSALLHVGVMLALMTTPPRAMRPRVAFEESAGVALMARLGYVAPSEDDPAEPTPEEPVEEPPVEYVEPAPPPAGSGEPAPAEEPPEEVAGPDTPDETPPDEAKPETPEEPEPAPVVVAEGGDSGPAAPPAPRPRPTPRPEPTPEPGGGDGSAAASAPPDPRTLRPSARYPEGTVNPIATDVGMWGPEGAVSVAIIRADRIRRSPHRAAVESIFGALADYRDLSRAAGINIIDDVDTMLLASTNPMDARQTFIAAVHHLDAGYLMGQIARAYPSGVNWAEQNGRFMGTPGAASTIQRRFFVPTARLLIFSQPRFIDDLLRGAPRPQGLDGALERSTQQVSPPPSIEELLTELGLGPEPELYAPASDPCEDRRGVGRTRCREREDERERDARRAHDAWEARRTELTGQATIELERRQAEYSRARSNGSRNLSDSSPPSRASDAWINGLLEAGDLAGAGSDGPAIVWTFRGFSQLELGGMPASQELPTALIASLKLSSDPILRARWQFPSEEGARTFSEAWPSVCTFYTFALRVAGLDAAFRGATWEVDHDEAVMSVTMPRSSMTRLAAAASMAGLGGAF
ncbi:MAG: hypothetical protein H6700_11095 [Myxococcales bacterium]|nr:hypothetical protein [Myxococcales bacterium]MCB9519858.1 hypothetical protein [Myxococcales bacterium]MCB9532302.1 hypothetical protein [Myxococcales bacterium]